MKEKNGEHPFGDTGQLISLGVFTVVWIGDSFFLRQSTFLSNSVPLYVRLIILGLALITAVYLSMLGHIAISHGQRPDKIVTIRVFRYVGHPLYLASILTYLGLAVSTLSLFSLALIVGIFIFHNYIAGYEEKLLEAKFGEEYRVYKKKTGKWVPKIGKSWRQGKIYINTYVGIRSSIVASQPCLSNSHNRRYNASRHSPIPNSLCVIKGQEILG